MKGFKLVLFSLFTAILLTSCSTGTNSPSENSSHPPSPTIKAKAPVSSVTEQLTTLYVTSFNPLHQKGVPQLDHVKITNKEDIQTLYRYIQNAQEPKGTINCPMDTGVYLNLTFETATKKAITMTAHPTGCRLVKFENGPTKMLINNNEQAFWDLLAKDLNVDLKALSGFDR